MEQETNLNSVQNSKFSKIFEYCLLLSVLLLPIIFVPSIYITVFSAKIALIVTVAVVFTASLLASILSSGTISLPKSKFLIPLATLPFVAIISSFFSGAVVKSIAGQIFDLGTSGSIFLLTMIAFMAIFAVKDNVRVALKTYLFLIASSVIVLIHLVIKAFAVSWIPVSVASKIPSFLVGGSIDTSIFLSIVSIACLTSLNMLSLPQKTRYILYGVLSLSVLFVGATGFMPATILLGLFSLVYFVYTFSWSSSQDKSSAVYRKMSMSSLIVLAFSIIFIISSGKLGGLLSSFLNINSIEVRPNVGVTMNLISESWKQNALLGVGPNMFKELWDLKMPQNINLTQFWAAEFSFGSGFVPTMAATTGILGFLSILIFLAMYIKSGFKSIFLSSQDINLRYVSSTSFFVSMFLWAMAFIYSPSISILGLTFVFTGIFAGTLVLQGMTETTKINIFKNPKVNFASVFIIVVLLISSVAFGYFVWERVLAAYVFQKGDSSNAVNLAPTDLYFRGISGEALSKVGDIIGSVSSVDNLSESQKTEIQSAVSLSINAAREAISWDPKNYQNWFALGRIYEVLAINGLAGASESAKAAFTEAQLRAPVNPAIPLAFGRLSAMDRNLDEARAYISKAIELKGNYTDAYFTLAQLEVSDNNIPGAIKSVEAATLLDPQNAVLYFQLGLLKYNNKDYAGASKAFERAVEIIPDYANARYFLGLSYDRLGRDSDAIDQFENIQKSNPDNSEIRLILSNLKAGRSPFSDAKPPVDDKPEKRSNPPIEE